MINASLFLESLINRLNETEKNISSFIDKQLDKLEEGNTHIIDKEKFIKEIQPDIYNIIKLEIPEKIVALKFIAKEPINSLHSAWLSKSLREAEIKFSTVVGVKIRNKYVRKAQFEQMEKNVCVVAAGKDPKGAVMYVFNEDQKFDPNIFDEDGYVKN